MPRYVILLHEFPNSPDRSTHWDLMLEVGGVLRTWSLPQAPQPGRTMIAQQLPDHRLAYLDYEGPVSGNRGVVSHWDSGVYELVAETHLSLQVALRDGTLHGRASLIRSHSDDHHWDVTFSPSTAVEGR